MSELVDHVVMSAHSACDLIHELENLLEASFGGAEAEKVEKACHQLATYEWEADKKQFVFAQKAVFAGRCPVCRETCCFGMK